MSNRVAIGIPTYSNVTLPWVDGIWALQSAAMGMKTDNGQLAFRGVLRTESPYVDRSITELCMSWLQRDDWDYLMLIEHDNIIPPAWLKRVVEDYTDPVVGLLYFGRTQFDRRPIQGFDNEDGFTYNRLNFYQVEEMMQNPGMHEVDVLGTGAMVIRRDVLENWPVDDMPWFHTINEPTKWLGQDIRFCRLAKKQGHKILMDTTVGEAKHIGLFLSDYDTYKATWEWEQKKQAVPGAQADWEKMAGLQRITVPPNGH